MNTQTAGKSLVKIVIAALFIALSFVGANIKIFGTIAFDSLPAFLASLVLGPLYGVVVGFFGHMFTALTSGFPMTIPMHIAIGAAMAVTMLGFGYTHLALTGKVSAHTNLLMTGLVGILLNGPFSLAVSVGTMTLLSGWGAAAGLIALLPALVLASAVNIMIGMVIFKPLDKAWGRLK